MPLPSMQELECVIVDILTCAQEDDRLGQLTVRIVRQELTTHFDLEEDILCSGKFKSFIKETVHATVSRLESAPNRAELPQPQAPKKATPDSTSKSAPRQRKSKAQARTNEEFPGDADVSESEEPRSKRAPGRSESSKPLKPSKTSKKAESEMKFKSKAIIESSDEEGVSGSGRQQSTGSPKRGKIPAKPSPPKQKQQQNVKKDDSDVEMDPGKSADPSSSSSMPKPGTESSPKPSKAKESKLMESELSSVIDEPPKKRQKKQDKESTKPRKEEAKRGKKETLSKDEETVNKLKGIVVACGVRKVWKKEFEGLDRPSQQIKQLHAILNDLGMTPRYSLEKAKTIRDRRELAQELKDVQEFEKAVKKRGKGHRRSSELEKSADEGNDVSDAPAPKKKNARASIMAFLQDQSEEE